MITTSDDEKTITELSLLSGVSKADIEKVFYNFMTQFVFKYTNNKSIKIPFIGSILVRYKNEEESAEGKEAQVDAFYSPHPQIKRLVGQLKDIETSKNYTDLDVFTNLKKQIKQDFKTVISDDEIFNDMQSL